MSGPFGEGVPTIDRVTRDGASPLWVHVVVGRRRVASVTAARAEPSALRAAVAGPRAAVARRLAGAGHSGADVAAVAKADPGDDLSRAIEQARNRAAQMPESLGAPVRYRRVLAALARLGYEEDVAQEAAAAVVRIDDG